VLESVRNKFTVPFINLELILSNIWKICLIWHIPDFGLRPTSSFPKDIKKKSSTLSSTAWVSHLDKITNGKRGISRVLDSLLHRVRYLQSITRLKTVVDCEDKGQWCCDLFWDTFFSWTLSCCWFRLKGSLSRWGCIGWILLYAASSRVSIGTLHAKENS
jgi:hypothetical protein